MEEVKLKLKKEFVEVLANYQVSEHAHRILHEVEYVVLVGPAAGGRNTVINELVANHDFQQIISDTTRSPKFRDGKTEQHGVNYFFRSEEGMLDDLRAGEFLEAELIHDQQVSGTSIRELEKAATAGSPAINEIEFGGARNVLAAKPDTKVVAILPPSFSEWKRRFESREKISVQEFKNRIITAQKVIKLIREESRIRVVINHDFRQAAQEIVEFVEGKHQTKDLRAGVGAVLDDFEANFTKLLA
jgi:guanylate kinase